jgi:hypothetical protein
MAMKGITGGATEPTERDHCTVRQSLPLEAQRGRLPVASHTHELMTTFHCALLAGASVEAPPILRVGSASSRRPLLPNGGVSPARRLRASHVRPRHASSHNPGAHASRGAAPPPSANGTGAC